MLNIRSKKILYYLSQQNETISIKELASKFDVSERSIRNDIREINDWLKRADLSPLEQIKRKGVRISADAKNTLLKLNINNKAYIMSAQERRWIILGRLLFTNEILNISKLPDLLNVSQSTIVTDMRYVYQWMKVNRIKVYSKPHIGVHLGECELAIRRGGVLLLHEMTCSAFDRLLLSNFKELNTTLEHYISKEVASFFEDNRTVIFGYIQKIQKNYHYHLTDDGLWTAFLQLMVTLYSIEKRHCGEQLLEITTFYDRFYDPTSKINFEDLLKTCLSQEEINAENKYLNVVWHSGNRMADHESHSIFTKNEIHTFLHRLEVDLGYYIPWERNEILNTSKNLDVFINKHILGLRFPYEDEIEYSIEKWEQEFTICSDVLKEFLVDKSQRENYNPTKYETVQILVEVISSLANSEFEAMSNRHDIVVVCSGVISESSLIKYRLYQLFSNVNEIRCLPYHEFITMKEFLNYDLLLSTIDLPSAIGQYYKMSPVVTKEELMDLVHVMQFRFPLTEKRKIVNDTIDVMMKMPEIKKDQKAMLSVQIAKYLKEKHYYQPQKNLKGLRDLLTTDLISVRASVNTGNEAIQLAGNLLMKKGFISQKEIDCMIDWNERYPNYTVIDEGVAFPHLLTDGVDEPCISLVSLDHSVEMTNGGKKVSIIIMLVSNNNTSHIAIIEDIIDLLDNPRRKERIQNAKSIDDILSTINYK